MTKPSPSCLQDDLHVWKTLSDLQSASTTDWKLATGIPPARFSNSLVRLKTVECVKLEPEKKVYLPVREPTPGEYETAHEAENQEQQASKDSGKRWLLQARDFQKEHYPNKRERLIYYRGSFYHWTGSHYAAVDDEALSAQIYMWMEKPGIKPVSEVLKALKSATHISQQIQAPTWLNPGHAIPTADYVWTGESARRCRFRNRYG